MGGREGKRKGRTECKKGGGRVRKGDREGKE